MNIAKLISDIVSPWGVLLDGEKLSKMETFADALIEKNKVMNLTAITEPERVAALHFADCLYLLACAPLSGKRVIDVGCGGGFPSVPLLCADPSIDLTGIDSTAKRIAFLADTCSALSIGGRFVAARAEEYALKNRESFDVCVSRAVAPLNILSELCLPLVRVGGLMLAMKGMGDEEIDEGKSAIKTLGGKIREIKTYSVGADFPERRVVIIEKISETPKTYPRRYAKITAKPL